MKCICGHCNKQTETETFPESWVVSKMSYGTEREETGENPLGHGVVRAFCSSSCEEQYRTKYYQTTLFQKA